MRTASSTARGGAAARPCRTARAPLVRPTREQEDEEAREVLAHEARAPADAERQPPVRGGVADGGDGQGGDVRPGGAERAAEQEEQQRVGDRAEHADAHEPRDRAGQREAGDALEVLDRRADDVDARVGVVDPVDRHLVDAQAAPLGEDEQLGVEEPGVVADVGEEAVERVAADGLEAALRVGEAGAQRRVQQAVVAARDDLALRAADDAGALREPRADRDVAVAGEQRGDERQQRAEVGREVDVHVADDPRAAPRPGGPQRAAAALALQVQVLDAAQALLQVAGDGGRAVRARVVGDDDPPAEREGLGEEPVQAPDALLEDRLLVVDGHDDVDVAGGRESRRRGRGRRDEGGGFGHGISIGPARGIPVGAA